MSLWAGSVSLSQGWAGLLLEPPGQLALRAMLLIV